jgi:hypothetical protein
MEILNLVHQIIHNVLYKPESIGVWVKFANNVLCLILAIWNKVKRLKIPNSCVVSRRIESELRLFELDVKHCSRFRYLTLKIKNEAKISHTKHKKSKSRKAL